VMIKLEQERAQKCSWAFLLKKLVFATSFYRGTPLSFRQ
jgi:hypothetical protein